MDLIVELPSGGTKSACSLAFRPVVLEAHGVSDESLWRKARRGWFNTWQPSSRCDNQDRPFSAPAGILSNNVISDPVSFALPFYADQALWRPQLTPEISAMDQVRRTIEWWLDHRTDSSGEVVGYWNYRNFLDANPGILISAWDYVESSKDYQWLRSRLPQLEALSRFLERRDIDHDGMVEATQSGNLGTLIQPARSCCWWETLNCGYKDGYANAMIYRAWCCLADLENQVQRTAEANRLIGLAQRLRVAYRNALFNPQTGWLAWWKSEDGRLHDYATPIVNGLAISFGLVEPMEGRAILARLWKKMHSVNFTRLDLGLPCTLLPVPKAYYLQPDAVGGPGLANGEDTFQQYMNGGISAGHSLHFIVAHYVVGEQQKGDTLLRAMLSRQDGSGFQNGVINSAGGLDWTTWNGSPCGYEGYLADVFAFVQAVILSDGPRTGTLLAYHDASH